MRILVTGGSGYIGHFLIGHLLSNGHYVTSIDKRASRGYCNNPQFSYIEGDVTDLRQSIVEISRFDVVIPLAAIVGRTQCDLDSQQAWNVNYNAIKNLVPLLTPNQLLIYPQTNMGFRQELFTVPSVFNDNERLQPISSYVQTKILGEEVALTHKKSLSLRLSSVFGVSNPMKDHLLLHFMIKEAVLKRKLSIFQPDFFRAFVSLRDLANLVNFIIQTENKELYGQKINVSDPRLNITKMEIALAIQRLTGCKLMITNGSDPDQRNYLIRSQTLNNLGFQFSSNLEAEFQFIVKYYSQKY